MKRRTELRWLSLVTQSLLVLGYFCAAVVASPPQVGGMEAQHPGRDVADEFEFLWNSTELSVNVASGDGNQRGGLLGGVPTLTISVKLNILDTNDLLSLDVRNPVVVGVIDQDDGSIEWQAAAAGDRREYHRVGVESVSEGCLLVDRLLPSDLTIELRLDPNRPTPSSLSLVEGYLYGLYVDSIVKVDIPYDPDGGWIEPEVVPDMMLCVDPLTAQPPGPLEYEPPLPSAPSRSPLRPKAIATVCVYNVG